MRIYNKIIKSLFLFWAHIPALLNFIVELCLTLSIELIRISIMAIGFNIQEEVHFLLIKKYYSPK